MNPEQGWVVKVIAMRLGFAVCAAAVLLVPALSAASKVTEQAESAIRDLITSSTGYKRTYISEIKENRLSGDEARVMGEGVASDRNGWGGVPFKFSIKVRNNDFQTRDALVEFIDGRKLNSRSEWNRPLQTRGYEVTFTYPRWYQSINNDEVRFEGRSYGEGEIQVTVYDRSGRQVRDGRGKPDRNGTWAVALSLGQGTYRAVAHRRGWNEGDEVRFSVGRNNGQWGEGDHWGTYRWKDYGGGSWGSGSWQNDDDRYQGGGQNASFRVTGPRQGERVESSRVHFQGTSRERTIYVNVYDGSRRIERETVSVDRDGRWERTVTLDDGRYRAVVESGRDRKEISFEVRSDDRGPSGGGSGSFRVTGPRQNERVMSNRVYFQGNSNESTIYINVYQGSRRIERETVSVERNGSWGRTVTLENGSYRAVVESGRDRREVSFQVNADGNGSGGGQNASFRVTGPRQNERVQSKRVAFQGTSGERTIYISVYEGSRRIERETVSVDRNGSWTRTITLSNGRYRAVVESGRDRKEINFEVRE